MEELIIKYLAGEATPDEAKQLFAWVEVRPENKETFERYQKVVSASDAYFAEKRLPAVDIDAEWAHFKEAIDKPEARTIELHASRPIWMKLAAAFLVLIISGFVINWFLRSGETVFQTESASRVVMLPDGSKVTLNTNSRLSYEQNAFGNNTRTVQLDGEAFFEVAHDAKKPFLIKTYESTVEVVGTSFDVGSYSTEGSVVVVVETGIVKLSADNAEVKLTAGQKGVFAKTLGHIDKIENDDINFLSWNTRVLVFDNTDLSRVVETINRTYNAHITLPADVPATCSLTGKFDHQSLEAVLHVLEKTLGLKFRKSGDKIEIIATGC